MKAAMVLRKPWFMMLVGLLAVASAVILAMAARWRSANRLPSYAFTSVAMPVPNGFDDMVEAARLSQESRRGPLRDRGIDPAALVRWAPSQRLALARLRQGLARPSYRPMLSALRYGPVEYSGFHQLALLLLAEGRQAEREGRTVAAAHSYLDCLRLGVHSTRGGSVMELEFALMIQRMGLKSLQELTERLDGATAAAAAREMTHLEATAPTLADGLTVERDRLTLTMLQVFQDPDGWRQFAPVFVSSISGGEMSRGQEELARLRFGLMRKRPILDGMRGYVSALIVDARYPVHARTGTISLPNDPLSPWMLIGSAQYGQYRREWATRDAWWRVTAAGLAALAYRKQHRAPPESLRALVPVYLPRVPADPFAPQPLRYRLRGGRPVIYSRGPDGDDDLGRDLGINVLPGAGRFPPPTDGDLVSMKGMTDDGR